MKLCSLVFKSIHSYFKYDLGRILAVDCLLIFNSHMKTLQLTQVLHRAMGGLVAVCVCEDIGEAACTATFSSFPQPFFAI